MFTPPFFLRRWALLLSLFSLATCQSRMEDNPTKKFDLSVSACTPAGNPVEVVEGHCSGPGGTGPRVPSGYYLAGDWTGSGTGEVVGSPFHAAPDTLHLRWFSFAEDTFYEGDFPLPRPRIYALLKEGYWDNDANKHDTYSDLTVCVLPGGGAVVWLNGGNKVVLGRYQGHAIRYDFASFKREVDRAALVAEERAKLPAAVQAQLRAGTFGPGQWDTYLVKYPWRVEVVVQNDKQALPLPLYNHYAEYFSAENDSYPVALDRMDAYLDIIRQPTPKAVPQVLGIFVDNHYGEKHEIRINPFDEAETLAAFQALAARHPKEPMVLRIEVDKLYTQYKLSLSNGFQTVSLDKATVKIFEED